MKVRIRWAPEPTKMEPAIIERPMIEAFGATDPGCVRGNNEDCYLIDPALGLYVMADGMGGAQAGEYASALAAKTVREVIANRNGGANLAGAFKEANRRVMQAAARDSHLEGMGTTLVAALNTGKDLSIASVGDSRAYLYERGVIRAITEDQTWVNEVGRRLGLEESALKTHPMRHVLTVAVGISEDLRIHTYTISPGPGAQILLCSDGLHGVVGEEELASTLASERTLEAKCHQLIGAARAKGGPDNITAVLLRITSEI